MANLSQDDRDIIEKYPLDNNLDHLRGALREAEQSYDAAVDDSGQGAQKAISRLLWTLQGHEAALDLRSKTSNQNVASELSTIFRRVQNRDFNYEHYRALVRLVVQKPSEVDIWGAVFNLMVTVSRLTPPTSIAPSFNGTPITHSSASQQGGEQTRREVEERIFEDCTYRDVEGFFPKYFEEKYWTERTKKIYRAVQDRHVDGRWTDFPDPPVQNDVLEWPKGENISKTVHDWKDVEVIGELRESDKDWKTKLLQLGRYTRDIFSTQPTRRFLHGFTLLGSTMELWIFDRSGPYSSGTFNIHEEPEQFMRAIARYTMMSYEELSLDTFTGLDAGNRYITITEDATGKERRLQLEPDLIAYQRAIVCRGTSCFRAGVSGAKDPQYVVKFSWTSDKRQPEADLLRLSRSKGVKGVAKLFGHHRITSIAHMCI